MSLLSSLYNDPFFSGVNLPQALALEHRSRYDRQQNNNQDLDISGNPFAFMQNVMNNMVTTMNSNDFGGQTGHGVSFSSSTVMSMNSRNGGQPRIFQATSEKLRGPEGMLQIFLIFLIIFFYLGLERTRKAVRDTGRNLEKMEIAHRLGERSHRITKERDPSSGQLLENREFEHIEDENQFEREWFSRAEQLGLKNLNGNGFNSRKNSLLMTPSSFERNRSQSHEPRRLAIEQRQSNNKKERRKK
jgi:hypothetical protein